MTGETGLARDSLHIYVGMILFLLVALCRGRRLASKLAILAVLFAAGLGEVVDHSLDRDWPHDAAVSRHWHDVWNTCLWPLVLFLLANAMRLSPERPKPLEEPTDPPSGDSADQSLE